MFLGVDVGGTNTDAVLMNGRELIAAAKVPTTEDVTSGIVGAVSELLKQGADGQQVDAVMVGTTHFTNALLECKGLCPTGIIRLALPATQLLPPLVDWPDRMKAATGGFTRMVGGGNEFDGREISALERDGVREAVRFFRERGVTAMAVSGVFSPVDPTHENEALALIREVAPEMRVCLSHENGRMGLLERENAAYLNACLGDVAAATVTGIEGALQRLGIAAPLFMSQNDGTLMDTEFASKFPVLTASSGPTNSMRGAAFLSGITDGIVVDIGGTSTDVGALVKGFPRESAVAVDIAGVRTNFRTPDMVSIALGGGTTVKAEPWKMGPESVGYRLSKEALVFGGDTLTASDIAVARGRARIGDWRLLAGMRRPVVDRGIAEIDSQAEAAVDRVKVSQGDVPVVLVGGGIILARRYAEGRITRAATESCGSGQCHRRSHCSGRRTG